MGARVFALWKTKPPRRVFSQLPPPHPHPNPSVRGGKTSQAAGQPGPHIACSHIRPNSLAGVNMTAGEKMVVELVPLNLRPGSRCKLQGAGRSFNMSELHHPPPPPPLPLHFHPRTHTHQRTFQNLLSVSPCHHLPPTTESFLSHFTNSPPTLTLS